MNCFQNFGRNCRARIIIYWVFIVCIDIIINPSPVIGQSQQQLQKIDEFVIAQKEKSHIPGIAVCIVTADSMVFGKGYGTSSSGAAIDINTPFALASLSKAFTATAIIQLAEQGKLNIDSPAASYVKTLPSQLQKITIRQLLHQTSGLSDKVFPEMKFTDHPLDLSTAIARLQDVQLSISPGKKYEYHNPNYQLLARIVEVVSGKTFSDYLQTNLFDPLQMKQTKDVSTSQQFYKSGLTKGHSFLFGFPYALKEPDWFIDGGAGVLSSANDMSHWMMANLQRGKYGDQRIFSDSSMNMMLTKPDYINSSYAMGWAIGEDGIVRHTGIFWTYQSELVLMRREGFGIVILYNSGLNAFQDYSNFATGIVNILSGKETSLAGSVIWITGIIIVFIIIVLASAVIRFMQMNKWKSKISQVSRTGCSINILLRLLPIVMLALLPSVITAISGRVLSWPRLFYMMPEVIIWLVLLALFNLAVIITRWNSYRKIFAKRAHAMNREHAGNNVWRL